MALDKNISVTAGAGSGKTRILVERYLKIVLQNPKNVKRTLAFTFTNKAAGEMQERIVRTVNERLAIEQDQSVKTNLLKIRDQFNSAAISTIHAFCARTLREFPIESGLSPDFSEMDEMQQATLQQDAIQSSFEEINRTNDLDEKKQWYYLFSRLSRASIKDMLINAMGSPWDMELITNKWEGISEDSYIDQLNDDWLNLAKSIIGELDYNQFHLQINSILNNDMIDLKNENGDKTKHILRQTLSTLMGDGAEYEKYASLLILFNHMTTGNATAYKNAAQLGGQQSWSKNSIEQLVELSQLSEGPAQKLHDMMIGSCASENDRIWFRLFKIFIRLYQKTTIIYKQIKQDKSLVDFEDLQVLTLKLLIEQDRISAELKNRYNHILVDEFQDTNGLQWEIISQLATKNGKLIKDKIFVVGDPKQSIYGFRNADIRIFKQVKEIFANQVIHEDETDYEGNVVFQDSFRFLPRLNAFINHTFERILQEDVNNSFEVGYHPLKAKRELSGKGWIELALLQSDEDRVRVEADYLANVIKNLIEQEATIFHWEGDEKEEPVQYGDIAILLRSRTHLLEIEQALRSRNIPFKTAGGIGYWQQQEIYDFNYLLRFISNPKDDFALVAVLRSKMFLIPDSALFFLAREEGRTWWDRLQGELKQDGYSEDDKQILKNTRDLIKKWLNLRERITLADLLDRIVSDLHYRTILAAQLNGDQLVANLDKLIRIAQNFDAAGLGGLQAFQDNINTIINNEMREGEAQITIEDRDSVKIMTIHAAKGLQFPIVMVPYLNEKYEGRFNTVFLDNEHGLVTKLNSGMIKQPTDDHVLLNLIKYRQRQKELAEAKRLFYVAASRASNYLYLCAATEEPKASRDSALSWLSAAFSEDGIDIWQTEKINMDKFEVSIVHEFSGTETNEHKFSSLDHLLNQLKSKQIKVESKSYELPDYLKPLSDTIGPQIFSATRLMTYLENPEDYYHRYHLGFFEQDYDSFAADVYQTDHALLKGKIVHRYLELIESLSIDPDDLLQNIFFEFDIFNDELQNEFTSEIKFITERAMQSMEGRKIFSAKEYRNEVEVTAKLGEDYFTGTIDRMYKNEEGLWEIVDYKTNWIDANQVETIAKKYEWQIKAYAYLLSKLYPNQKTYPVSLYFLHPEQIYRQSFDRNETSEIENYFLKTISQIKINFT
ncbi:MAG: UvrD-helicase domain-containing protein [Calditrichaceae bacterium]